MKLYLVEDDESLSIHLAQFLEKFDYQVTVAKDFKDILAEFQHLDPQLVLLDVNLPYFDGYYWCQQIRKHSIVPIIFISSRNHPMDYVMAIEQGADDFVTKPFSDEVLLAKLKGQIRRIYGDYRQEKEERKYQISHLTFYPERLEIIHEAKKAALTLQEGKLLEQLMVNYPQISSREDLLLSLWDEESFVDDNTLSVNATRLRKKLEEVGLSDVLKTVRGVGYRLDIPGEKTDEKL